jgi:hypothetical protein
VQNGIKSWTHWNPRQTKAEKKRKEKEQPVPKKNSTIKKEKVETSGKLPWQNLAETPAFELLCCVSPVQFEGKKRNVKKIPKKPMRAKKS